MLGMQRCALVQLLIGAGELIQMQNEDITSSSALYQRKRSSSSQPVKIAAWLATDTAIALDHAR